jgi:formamidopyrimidine-DNA glycosylase
LPELPEVETVRRGLAPVLIGATIDHVDQRRPDLRFPFPADFVQRLAGRRVAALDRRAKYLLAYLDNGTILVMHLGMSGSFRIEAGDGILAPGTFHHPRSALGAHDHVVFTLSNGARVLYNDPRRFGFMLLVGAGMLDTHPLFANLGIEPLGLDLDGAALARLFSGRTTPLKAALLDQTFIAGLGNIYVCEALHRAGLSPRRAAGTLARRDGSPTARALRLADVIKEVLLEAVAAGGSTLRDHRQTDGTLGYFQHNFRVYDRRDDPCPKLRCAGIVKRMVQGGRSTFYCPTCQR